MAFPPPGSGAGPSSLPMFPFQQSQSQPSPQQSTSSSGGRMPGSRPGISNHFFPLGGGGGGREGFDPFDWYPQFYSCVRYFLDHAQYEGAVQALAALINIQLPFQKSQHPVLSSKLAGSPSLAFPSPSSRAAGKLRMPSQQQQNNPANARLVTLIPYIRRLVATGFDSPDVLHGFFGDDWLLGVGHIHEVERRNYLFAAKSGSWLDVKSHYDMPDEQSIPFLMPLQRVSEQEIVSAESNWSDWLAMQDWMLGPRSVDVGRNRPVVVKQEVS